jgi:hypothetical protein
MDVFTRNTLTLAVFVANHVDRQNMGAILPVHVRLKDLSLQRLRGLPSTPIGQTNAGSWRHFFERAVTDAGLYGPRAETSLCGASCSALSASCGLSLFLAVLLVTSAPVGDLATLPTVLDPPTPRAVFHALASLCAAWTSTRICGSQANILPLHVVDELEINAAPVTNFQAVCLACADLGTRFQVHVVLAHVQFILGHSKKESQRIQAPAQYLSTRCFSSRAVDHAARFLVGSGVNLRDQVSKH